MGLDMYAMAIDARLLDEDYETDAPVHKMARRAVGFLDLTDKEQAKLSATDREAYWDKKVQADAKAQQSGLFVGDLHYWRKHHDLHGWMEALYRRKGGTDPQFNCNTVRLRTEDLDELEAALKAHVLPHTEGFFFGNNPPDDDSLADDMEFIRKARAAIAQGKAVFYDSWW